jgi:hypothetical protein
VPSHDLMHVYMVLQIGFVLTVRVLWACHAFNATPKEAAQQVVADLYAHLSRGGSCGATVGTYSQLVSFGSNAGKLATGHGVK